MHRSTKLVKQGEARGALVRLRIIDGNSFEKGVDGRAQAGQRGHGGGEILLRDSLGGAWRSFGEGGDERGFGGFRGWIGGTGLPAGLGFGTQDVGGALVAGEEVGAVLCGDEGLQRVDAGEQADEIVLATEREDGVDQVVADAGLALLDFEAVDEELKQGSGNIWRSSQICPLQRVGSAYSLEEPSLDFKVEIRVFSEMVSPLNGVIKKQQMS